MTKEVVILGDTHIGARNSNKVVMEHQLKFFEDQLFPFMEKHGIKIILQTGDLFDERRQTGHIVLDSWRSRVFQYMKDAGIEFHMVLGNHDIATKNSLYPNSPSLLLSDFDNITVYDKPTVFEKGEFSMLMVPWICDSGEVDRISKMKADWCFGHFEFAGFEMHRGHTTEDGIDIAPFKRFETVISGHYHTRNTKGNITYVGTPYEMTWIDHGDPKGFHVLDTSDKTMHFVENTSSLFKKITYDDKDQGPDYYRSRSLSDIADSYVKIVVVNKTDPAQFDVFMQKVYSFPAIDVKVIDDVGGFDSTDVDDDSLNVEDTKTLIHSYVDNLDVDIDLERLKSTMTGLYVEALEVLQ